MDNRRTSPAQCACPCGGCRDLATALRRLDFSIIDVNLYLDVYPDCREAASRLANLRAERALVAAEYEKNCGMLTVNGVDASTEPRRDLPQPWEYAAN